MLLDLGHSNLGPTRQRRFKRILGAFLGQFEIAHKADEGGQHSPRLTAIDRFDCGMVDQGIHSVLASHGVDRPDFDRTGGEGDAIGDCDRFVKILGLEM